MLSNVKIKFMHEQIELITPSFSKHTCQLFLTGWNFQFCFGGYSNLILTTTCFKKFKKLQIKLARFDGLTDFGSSLDIQQL